MTPDLGTPGDILFYDGHCFLCMAEMEKLQQVKGTSLSLVDIHGISEGGDLPDRRTLLETLHLRKADGSLLTGLDANVAAWQHTRYAARWRLLQLPLVRQVAQMAYRLWAGWRYNRLYSSR